MGQLRLQHACGCLLAHQSSVPAKGFQYLFKRQSDIKLWLSSRMGALPSSPVCESSRAVPSFGQGGSASGQRGRRLRQQCAGARPPETPRGWPSISLAGTKRPLVLSVSVGNSAIMAKRVLCVLEVSISCSRLEHGVLLGSPSSSVFHKNGKGTNVNSLSQRLECS